MNEVSIMAADQNKLSSQQHWEDRWAGMEKLTLEFDPRRTSFREIDDLLSRNLPRNPKLRFLEVGCYPGSYLWYFNKRFGYQVSGLEYVEACCDKARDLLSRAGVNGEIIHEDLFSYSAPEESLWDIVGSFGFVEHFEDTRNVIQKHLALLKPGGFLVITVPNHHGSNGQILKRVSREKYGIHNRMSYADLLMGIEGCEGVKVLEGGYLGRLGFWNTGLYASASTYGRPAYLAIRSVFWTLEKMGRILPNSAQFSPDIAIIAQKATA